MTDVLREPPSFTCPQCEAVSFNPNDVEHRYCGSCHVFWEDLEKLPPLQQCRRVGHKWGDVQMGQDPELRPMEARRCDRCSSARILHFLRPEVREKMERRRKRAVKVLLATTLVSSCFHAWSTNRAFEDGNVSQGFWQLGLWLALTGFLLTITRVTWAGQTTLIEQPITVMELTPYEEDDDE